MAANDSSYNYSSRDPSCSGSFVMSTVIHSAQILLILPLSALVLCLGFQRWRRQRAASVTHSDFFTHNLAIMELIGVGGNIILFHSIVNHVYLHRKVGIFISTFPWSGQMMFPIFTCVDRYLAVVHPITYLRLKQGRGMRIRYISSGLVWLFCFVGIGVMFMFMKYPRYTYIPSACQMPLYLMVVTFCCISVLCALIRPRPGEVTRVRADKSKRRAFHIILIIMVVLCVRFGGNLFHNLISYFPKLIQNDWCVLNAALPLFNLPSSLVLPLLYLHRAGCKHNAESG